MRTAELYRLKAEELEQIASVLPKGPERDQYAHMAQQWRVLQSGAEAVERKGRLRNS